MSNFWVAYAMGIASVLLPLGIGALMAWVDTRGPQ